MNQKEMSREFKINPMIDYGLTDQSFLKEGNGVLFVLLQLERYINQVSKDTYVQLYQINRKHESSIHIGRFKVKDKYLEFKNQNDDTYIIAIDEIVGIYLDDSNEGFVNYVLDEISLLSVGENEYRGYASICDTLMRERGNATFILDIEEELHPDLIQAYVKRSGKDIVIVANYDGVYIISLQHIRNIEDIELCN